MDMFLEFLSLVDIFHLQKTKANQKLNQSINQAQSFVSKAHVSKCRGFQVIKFIQKYYLEDTSRFCILYK